jgi:hypothetical protein
MRSVPVIVAWAAQADGDQPGHHDATVLQIERPYPEGVMLGRLRATSKMNALSHEVHMLLRAAHLHPRRSMPERPVMVIRTWDSRASARTEE